MSRRAIPVRDQKLWATGDVKPWIDIDLLVKDGAGKWRPERFRVDSGTEISTFAAYDAKRLGLVVPARPVPVRHEQTGLEVRSGMLRFRIDGMDQTEYAVGCLLLGDPNVPPNPAQPAAFRRSLLQPLAILERLRFTAEKGPTGGPLYGELIVGNR